MGIACLMIVGGALLGGGGSLALELTGEQGSSMVRTRLGYLGTVIGIGLVACGTVIECMVAAQR